MISFLRPQREALILRIVQKFIPKDQYFTRCYRHGQKCNFFSRKTNEACISGYHRMSIVWFSAENQGDMENFPFFDLIFRRPMKQAYSKKNRLWNQTKSRKIIFSNLFFYGFYPLVAVIHKCYQTYCEFRLKMHFVSISMEHAASRKGAKSPQAVCIEIFVLLFAFPAFLIIAHDANLKQIIFYQQIEFCACGRQSIVLISTAPKLIKVIYWLLLHKLNSSLSLACRSLENKKWKLRRLQFSINSG